MKYSLPFILALVPVAGMAITPINGGLVSTGTPVTINNSPGDQTLPHVSGNLAAYTDVADGHIHYYDFTSGVDAFVPPDGSLGDTLSDVSGTRVAFTRQTPTSDFEGFESTVPPSLTADIYIYVIATNTLYQVTNTAGINESLNDISVLPNGQVRIVWAADDGAASTQNIYASTFSVPLSNPTNTPGCATGFGTGFGAPALNKSFLAKVSAFAFAAEYKAGAAGPIGALGFVDKNSGASLISSNLSSFITTGSHVTIKGSGRTGGGATVNYQAEIRSWMERAAR